MQEQRYVPGVHFGRFGPGWKMGFTLTAIAVLLIGIGVGIWFLIESEPAVESATPAAVPVSVSNAATDEALIERTFVQTEPLAAMDQGLIERAFVQTKPLAAMDQGLIERVVLPTQAEIRTAAFEQKDAIEEHVATLHAWTDPFEKNR